jgi:predicted RNA binding protein YcfA (HicA-like mRNA interferase family)
MFRVIRQAASATISDCPWVKVREIIKLIEADGWWLVRTRGSHRQYKHPSKPGLVTVAGNLQNEVAPGTLNSIMKQAGLKK